jgi:uncharacterized membrane protein YhaH (DUF805 family)
MNWMLMPLKRYADFKGRSRRKEYWMWVLFQCIVVIVLSVLDRILGLGGQSAVQTGPVTAGTPGFGYSGFANFGVLTAIWYLATLVPNLAVAVRRLHDIDRTGWWILMPLVPYLLGAVMAGIGVATGNFALLGGAGLVMVVGFVLAIVLLVFNCLPGTQGPNRFGPDPLDPGAPANLSEVFN